MEVDDLHAQGSLGYGEDIELASIVITGTMLLLVDV